MRQADSEGRLITLMLGHPELVDPSRAIPDILDEPEFVGVLKENRVSRQFQRRMMTSPPLRAELFSKFPRIEEYYNELNSRYDRQTMEFQRVKEFLTQNGVEFILFKSEGLFPHDSDNLDMLIKPGRLRDAANTLQQIGYEEIPSVREPSKYLFRNPESLIMPHIHTRIEWEGTQFVDSERVWHRRRVGEEEYEFLVPSPEDCILVNAAHLFFENHEIRLNEMLKISSLIGMNRIDWDYVFSHANRFHWEDALSLTLLWLNLTYGGLYGREMFPSDALSGTVESGHEHLFLYEKIARQFSGGLPPNRIPYAFAGLFFLRRVLSDPVDPLLGRLGHLVWVASDVFKRRALGSEEAAFPTVHDN